MKIKELLIENDHITEYLTASSGTVVYPLIYWGLDRIQRFMKKKYLYAFLIFLIDIFN